MYVKTQGLILRETNYKEADKILTVLTREGGKRTVKARGCRRRNSPLAASAQLLAWSDMTLFAHRERFTLQEAEPLDLFWGVRADVEKLALASYFAEAAGAAMPIWSRVTPATRLMKNTTGTRTRKVAVRSLNRVKPVRPQPA